MNNNNEKQIIFLPNFSVYSMFNNTVLGVFIAVLIGIMTEIAINNVWNCESVIFCCCCFTAIVLLCLAILINSRVNELCQNIVVNDTDNKFKTSTAVLVEFWSKKNGERYKYRYLRHGFLVVLLISFVFFLFGAASYFIEKSDNKEDVPVPVISIYPYCHFNNLTKDNGVNSILNNKLEITNDEQMDKNINSQDDIKKTSDKEQ